MVWALIAVGCIGLAAIGWLYLQLYPRAVSEYERAESLASRLAAEQAARAAAEAERDAFRAQLEDAYVELEQARVELRAAQAAADSLQHSLEQAENADKIEAARRATVLKMAEQGKTQSEMMLATYGYIGGAAHHFVKSVLRECKNSEGASV